MNEFSKKWHETLLKKVKNASFFSEKTEDCLANFVTGSWLQDETLQKSFSVSTLELEQMYSDAYKLYNDDHFSESEKLFRFLVMLNPFVEKYWLGLGAVLQMKGQYEEALKSYGVLACLDETSPYPYFYASECLEKLNRKEESKEALKRAYTISEK